MRFVEDSLVGNVSLQQKGHVSVPYSTVKYFSWYRSAVLVLYPVYLLLQVMHMSLFIYSTHIEVFASTTSSNAANRSHSVFTVNFFPHHVAVRTKCTATENPFQSSLFRCCRHVRPCWKTSNFVHESTFHNNKGGSRNKHDHKGSRKDHDSHCGRRHGGGRG